MDFLKSILASPELVNALIGLFGLVLMLIINRGAGAIEAFTGIRIEAAAREALHSAIKSGVEAAVLEGPGAGFEVVKAHAIYHAQQSVPDAIERLVPGDGVLDRIALRYYREAMASAGVKIPEAA
ncbi:hypothetical protein [Alloyangia pacifica]|uniref:Uncharacterized protein n=1 Tax=Alloyangia pacifica TaxID=311180 RepID=A0A1I6QKF1_9RHOB|nr:hypothetical protein [Alloyangia pacifica]SDF91921.1 hypothetical protein SAMN04488245_101133 [Alloyangia pacifica]SFS52967.1 hypothetical protein SAMN04488050_102134 [Alloyangia pacifica]